MSPAIPQPAQGAPPIAFSAPPPTPALPVASSTPPPIYFSPPPAKKSRTPLIVGLALLAILVVAGIAVGAAYASASSAVASLEATCASSSDSVNWVGLSITVLTSSFNPDVVLGTIQIEYGIHNPSTIGVGSSWIIQISLGSSLMSDREAFTVPAGTTQLVTFHFPITVTTGIAILSAGLSNTSPKVSLTRDDSAFGFHFTHQFISSGPSPSNTNPGSNSASNLPSC